jgi:hypothetical protein
VLVREEIQSLTVQVEELKSREAELNRDLESSKSQQGPDIFCRASLPLSLFYASFFPDSLIEMNAKMQQQIEQTEAEIDKVKSGMDSIRIKTEEEEQKLTRAEARKTTLDSELNESV